MINMKKKFVPPDFSTGEIEVRFEDSEFCIYATDSGLEKLISYCESLLKDEAGEHIHLEDYDVLTANSLKGVIAKFEKK